MKENNINNIQIDVTKVPQRVQMTLAAATLDMYNRILAEPGGKEALGISQAAVALWENGSSNPTIDKLKKLAELFNCSVDELI